jgi:hypothetical protein
MPAVGPGEQAKLIKSGDLKPEEALLHLTDAQTGKPVTAHGGSVYWNEYRRRWVMIAVETFGTSVLGEAWFAEADTPLGPWVYARKIVTHDKYSFYNPKQHPFFDKDKGRVIFFEGTYTTTFSGSTDPTPRYDYNQVMYKLDLADPRLALPVPFYALSGDDAPDRFGTVHALKPKLVRQVAFLALDREVKGTVAVYAAADKGGLSLTPPEGRKVSPLCYAWPPDTKEPPPGVVPLHEFRHGYGRRAYSTDKDWSAPGFERAAQPLCLVWRSPRLASWPED